VQICYEASTCCGIFTKHCNFNAKIEYPLNDETPKKLLYWLAVVLFLKVWKQIYENDYYGLKRGN